MAKQKNTPAPAPAEPAGGISQEADRRAKLKRLREELAIDPYGRRTEGLVSLAYARASYDEVADASFRESGENDQRPVVKVAGRIMLHRDVGKLVFATLRDGTGDLQVAISRKSVGDKAFRQAKLADLGDIAVVSGPLGTTKTGEITVWAEGEAGFLIATKSLLPPPEKWKGLQDAELRYRQRYVDMFANPDVLTTFAMRSKIVQRVRRFFADRGFLEVETPMLQAQAGGAAARPFSTHHNALDIDLFLRIAPELYLKRLLVGGMNRVFEINRNFRNEGIDRSHNPEFTMLELYEAFGDYNSMMELTETLLHELATALAGGPTLTYGEREIDFSLPFRRAAYHDLFREHNGFDAADHDQLVAKARELHIDPAQKDHDVLLNEIWEETVEPHLVQPTFVIDYPASLCPLTKTKPDRPEIAERFELFIANMEIANAYTELNDPDIQEANFRRQVAGLDDEEQTFRTVDTDFLNALKVGMPPAGGLGIGIDRVIMLLTDSHSIRDVILFPLLRPQD